MSQTFDLYLAGDSWLHRMDPRAKLALVSVAGIVGLLFQHIAVLATLLILAHLALLSANVPSKRIGWLWVSLAPLLVLILTLQPFFTPGPGPSLFQIGPIRLTIDGILLGVSFALRAAALAFVAMVLLLTTDSNELVQGLVKMGLPYPWGLTVGLAIRYVPTTFYLFQTVREAQQARGWLMDQGNPLTKVRAYVPILVATIINALRLGDNLGLALAARGLGYPAKRTALHDVHMSRGDWLAVGLAAVTLAGLLILRYGLGFGATPLY